MIPKLFKQSWNEAKSFTKETLLNGFLYTILLILSVVLIPQGFSAFITRFFSWLSLPEVTTSVIQQRGVALTSLVAFLPFFIFSLVLLLYAVGFFELSSWNAITKSKNSFRITSKFVLQSLILFVLLGLFIVGIFYIYLALYDLGLSVLGFALHALSILFSFYVFFTASLSFSKTHRILHSIKNGFTIPVKQYRILLVQLIIAALVLLASNIITPFIFWLPATINLTVQLVVFSLYIAWFRIYLANALHSVKL